MYQLLDLPGLKKPSSNSPVEEIKTWSLVRNWPVVIRSSDAERKGKKRNESKRSRVVFLMFSSRGGLAHILGA